MILNILKRRKSDFLTAFIAATVFFSIFATMGLMLQRGDATFFPLGSMMEIFIGIIVMTIGSIGSMARDFNLGVSMGATRRSVVSAVTLVHVLEIIMLYALTFIFQKLELVVAHRMLPDAKEINWIADIAAIQTVLASILLIGAIGLLAQAAFLKFGNAAVYVLGGIWLAVCILPSRITSDARALAFVQRMFGPILEKFGGVSQTLIALLMCIVAVIFAAIAWSMLRKQQVQ